jgi:hypothetical protein
LLDLLRNSHQNLDENQGMTVHFPLNLNHDIGHFALTVYLSWRLSVSLISMGFYLPEVKKLFFLVLCQSASYFSICLSIDDLVKLGNRHDCPNVSPLVPGPRQLCSMMDSNIADNDINRLITMASEKKGLNRPKKRTLVRWDGTSLPVQFHSFSPS